MEHNPITRTIVWTGQRWVDQETGVYASNLGPPPDEAVAFGDAPLQQNHHPFDKSFAVTYKQVQKMIADALEQRTVHHDHYFVNDPTRIASYGYVRQAIAPLSSEINVLERRLFRLEKPWWKRWFR